MPPVYTQFFPSNLVNLVRTRKRRQAVISLANPMKLNKTKTSFFVGQSEKMLESMECCKVSLFCPWINRKCLGSDRVFIAPISHPEDVHWPSPPSPHLSYPHHPLIPVSPLSFNLCGSAGAINITPMFLWMQWAVWQSQSNVHSALKKYLPVAICPNNVWEWSNIQTSGFGEALQHEHEFADTLKTGNSRLRV